MPEKELLLVMLAVEVPGRCVLGYFLGRMCAVKSPLPLPLSMGHLEDFLLFGTFPFFGVPRMYVSCA